MGNKTSKHGKMIKLLKRNSPYWPGIIIEKKEKSIILCVCHHHPDRSFYFYGIGNYLCARCLGILVGGLTSILVIIEKVFPQPLILIIFLIPLIFDGTIQAFTNYESTNIRRLVTGLLFGYAITSLSYIFSVYCINFIRYR